MVCIGSCNHYLTKQRIKMTSMEINIKFIGEEIVLQYSPSSDCGWMGKHEGQTVVLKDGNVIWIRNNIYTINDKTPQVYFKNDHNFLDKSIYIHNLKIILKNKETSYYLDDKLIISNISLKGSKVTEQDYFHFGIASWSEDVICTILNIEINKI